MHCLVPAGNLKGMMWQPKMGRSKTALVQGLEDLPEEFQVVGKGSSPDEGDLECPESEEESVKDHL